MKPTLIIDADDTLWETEVYYEDCVADLGRLMAAQGFDAEEAERTADDVERERVPLVGYGPKEFAGNLVLAYERLCERYGRPVVSQVADAVWKIGQRVLDHPIVLLDGVAETLPHLGDWFFLLLLTKGDTQVQQDKLARSGLGHFFDGVHVVTEKHAGVIESLVAEYGLRLDQTWMVGNSPRSDINPALEAGVGAIHIPHSRTWVFEDTAIGDPDRVIVLNRFGELMALFAPLFAHGESGERQSQEHQDHD
jgi:putative hydrolase of the HAD superfamily